MFVCRIGTQLGDTPASLADVTERHCPLVLDLRRLLAMLETALEPEVGRWSGEGGREVDFRAFVGRYWPKLPERERKAIG